MENFVKLTEAQCIVLMRKWREQAEAEKWEFNEDKEAGDRASGEYFFQIANELIDSTASE